MRRSTEGAFSLIEVAVAVAVMAILAGAAVPLVLKAVNQQREQRTRDDLKTAWEGLFGARDRRVVNMRADYGYDPGGPTPDLSAMTRRGAVPAYAFQGNFYWGWNGPYWNGSTGANATLAPLDAWGNAIKLRQVTGATPGFQVISGGPNGRIDTANNSAAPQVDDLVYPVIPAPLNPAYQGTVYVNVWNARGGTIQGTVTLASNLNGAPATSSKTVNLSTLTPGNYSFQYPSGVSMVTLSITTAPATTQIQVLDLLPGQVQTLTWTVN